LTGRTPITPLLWIFAVSLLVGTVLTLGLGFDLFVQPPDVPDTATFPERLQAMQPFFAARWPYDAVATLLFVIGFGALALAAGGIASLGGRHRLADVFRASMLVSGILGVVAGLLYFGATRVTIDIGYCDCGFIETELIGQFWALTIVQNATDWLSNGVIVFGALAAALSTVVLHGVGLPSWWKWIAWAAAVLLIVSIVLNELTDTPAGDIAVGLATAILLPVWAIMVGRLPSSPTASAGEV
jgi:hypothetical protein